MGCCIRACRISEALQPLRLLILHNSYEETNNVNVIYSLLHIAVIYQDKQLSEHHILTVLVEKPQVCPRGEMKQETRPKMVDV